MAGMGDTAETALWARWRALPGQPGADPAPEPDALLLATYAEGRLDEAAAEAVELWLAEYPDGLADLAAARAATEISSEAAPESVIAQAAALVAATDTRVVPFRRAQPAQLGWRAVAAWGGLAASIMATSLIGFQLGSAAYLSLNDDSTAEAVQQELFDPPGSGILPSSDEESAI